MKTSLIAYTDDFVKTGEIHSALEYSKLKKKMLSMAKTIAMHREPVKHWVIFLLIFTRTETLLATAIAIATGVIFAYWKNWKEKKNNFILYKQLDWYSSFMKEEKLTKRLIDILAEGGKSTGTSLAESYQKIHGEPIKPSKITEVMKHIEETGLEKRDIINKEGEPRLVWRSWITS